MCMGNRQTQIKGDLATAYAIATFTELGYQIALPLTESAPYDLIVDTGQEIVRVQVKFSSSGRVDLRRIHSNSQGYVVKRNEVGDYDWLYVLTNEAEYLLKRCFSERSGVKMVEKYKLRERRTILDGWQNGIAPVLKTEIT